MIVPYEELSTEALRGLIEEFVTRPGTDTGYTEGSLEANVEMVLMQLKLGDVLVVYDAITQTTNLIPKSKLKEVNKAR
ncbi:MAG: YheU family protein [Desulfobulbaceae bacterium]|nr:YheU family protein [Desulfobulbaceae bacterium]